MQHRETIDHLQRQNKQQGLEINYFINTEWSNKKQLRCDKRREKSFLGRQRGKGATAAPLRPPHVFTGGRWCSQGSAPTREVKTGHNEGQQPSR